MGPLSQHVELVAGFSFKEADEFFFKPAKSPDNTNPKPDSKHFVVSVEAPTSSLEEWLKEIPLGDEWLEAELWSVTRYIRSSKLLQLPEDLKKIVDADA